MRRQGAWEACLRRGVAFRPMVWSAEGRPHPVTMRLMNFTAEIASRKVQGLDPKAFVFRREKLEWSRHAYQK